MCGALRVFITKDKVTVTGSVYKQDLRCVEPRFAKTHCCPEASTSSTHNNGIISVIYDSISTFSRVKSLTHAGDRAYVASATEQTPRSICCKAAHAHLADLCFEFYTFKTSAEENAITQCFGRTHR